MMWSKAKGLDSIKKVSRIFKWIQDLKVQSDLDLHCLVKQLMYIPSTVSGLQFVFKWQVHYVVSHGTWFWLKKKAPSWSSNSMTSVGRISLTHFLLQTTLFSSCVCALSNHNRHFWKPNFQSTDSFQFSVIDIVFSVVFFLDLDQFWLCINHINVFKTYKIVEQCTKCFRRSSPECLNSW